MEGHQTLQLKIPTVVDRDAVDAIKEMGCSRQVSLHIVIIQLQLGAFAEIYIIRFIMLAWAKQLCDGCRWEPGYASKLINQHIMI